MMKTLMLRKKSSLLLIVLIGLSMSYVACKKDVALEKSESDYFIKYFGSTSKFGKGTGSDIKQTSDGGYISVGTDFSSATSQILLVKTDQYGNKEWIKEFGSDGNDAGRSVQVLSDDSYVVIGTKSVKLNDTTTFDKMYMLRVNNSGDEIWSKEFGGNYNANGYAVAQTKDGGFILVGDADTANSNGNRNGTKDMFIVKTDAVGTQTWFNFFGGASTDKAYDVLQKRDGGYLVLGTTESYNEILQEGSNCIVVDVNDKGFILDRFTYGGLFADEGADIEEIVGEANGGYIFAGTKTSSAAVGNIYLVKLEKNIHKFTEKIFESSTGEIANSIVRTETGYFVGGGKINPATNNYDQYLMKLDFALDTVWTRTYGSTDNDIITKVVGTSDNGVAGIGYSNFAGNQVFTMMKVNEYGDMK